MTEALSEFAVTINDVPNAILESVELLRSFLDEEGRFQVFSALDAHVFAQIVAATPAFGTSGADLIAQIRNGVATMRSTGANPDLLVLNPTTGATLDLSTSGTSTPYLFPMRETGSSSPLYGLKVIQRTSAAGTEPPYLIDSKMLGVLYLSGLKFDADPYTGFRKNLTTLRIEVKRLYHVRNVQGARKDRGDMTEAEAKKLAAERGWEVQKQDKSFRLMDHNGGFVTGGDWANPDSEFYGLSLADLATALES